MSALSTSDQESEKPAFIAAAREALSDGTFVRIVLGKHRNKGEPLRTEVTRLGLKGEDHLRFVTHGTRSDRTENLGFEDGLSRLSELIGSDYLSATLFTTQHDVTLAYSKKRVPRLSRGRATFTAVPPAVHDRAKAHIISPSRPYLKALGVSDDAGRVKPTMFAKYKQIARFVEIVDALLRESGLVAAKAASVMDIGCGKGYLTFALYDHMSGALGMDCRVTGIDVRADLVTASSEIARALGFSGLTFEAAEAASVKERCADVAIALHACDTATDDAMAQGVLTGARLIVCSPCCQHEIAPQMRAPGAGLRGLTRYPLLKQRQADLVTDAARALLLEASGYAIRVIEFVSTEHTAKNILIAAVKSSGVDRDRAREEYRALKALAGFETQALEMQLKDAIFADLI